VGRKSGGVNWDVLRKIMDSFICDWYNRYKLDLNLLLLKANLNMEFVEFFIKNAAPLLYKIGEIRAYSSKNITPNILFKKIHPFFESEGEGDSSFSKNIYNAIRKIVSETIRKNDHKEVKEEGERAGLEDLEDNFYRVFFHPIYTSIFAIPLFYDVAIGKVSLRFTDILKLSQLSRRTVSRALKNMLNVRLLYGSGRRKVLEYFPSLEGLETYLEARHLDYMENLLRRSRGEFLNYYLMLKGALYMSNSSGSYRIYTPEEVEEMEKNLALKTPVKTENLEKMRETVRRLSGIKRGKSVEKPEEGLYFRALPKTTLSISQLDFLIEHGRMLDRYVERLRILQRVEKTGITSRYEITDELGTEHQEEKILKFLRRKRMETERKFTRY